VTKQQVGKEVQSLFFLISTCQCAVSDTSGRLRVPNWWFHSFTSDKSWRGIE